MESVEQDGDGDGSGNGGAAAQIAAVPPPRSFECPVVHAALAALTEAGALYEERRRLERVIEHWETEVEFWAAAFGGKEAL